MDDVLPLAVRQVTEHPEEPDELAVRPVKLYPDSSSKGEEQGHLKPVSGHRDDQSSDLNEDNPRSDHKGQSHVKPASEPWDDRASNLSEDKSSSGNEDQCHLMFTLQMPGWSPNVCFWAPG